MTVKLKKLILLFLLLVNVNAFAQIDRAYTPRFSTNDFGNIALVGNGLLTCDAGNANCGDIQSGTVSGGNYQQMAYINVDVGAGFSNSSSADLNLPAGSTVLFAGLYWGGRDDENEANRGTIQMREPGAGSYSAVNATVIDTFTTQGAAGSRPYQAFADVTSRVQAAGNGTYFVGDLSAETGNDGLGFYGGWSLTVIYKDINQPYRRLMIYDGAARVSGTTTVTVNVTGLLTPASGSFDTFLGALVWEGDQNIVNDRFVFEGNAITDSLNPNNNFWNSSNTRLDSTYVDRSPSYVNQLAMDLDYIDVSGLLANGVTGAQIDFETSGDTYFPNVLAFATDLFVPDLVSSLSKTANDLNGGDVEPGDVIEYTITFENTGADGATNTVLSDVIPVNTTYVPNSINVTSADVGPSGPQNDTVGNGECGFDGTTVICGLGAGASNGNGGTFLQNEGATIVFRVTVDANVPAGDITNTVDVLHNSQTFPSDEFTGSTDAVITILENPEITVTKNAVLTTDANNNSLADAGDEITFTVLVQNTGNVTLTNLVVNDPMATGGVLTCSPTTLAPGATATCNSYTYTVTQADVDNGGTIDNTASATAQDPSNNPVNDDDSTNTPVVVAGPSLVTAKSMTNHNDVDGDTVISEGDILTFTITATNNGNVTLNNVVVTDTLINPSSITCATVAPGDNCELQGTYTVTQADVDNGQVENTGTGDSDETPPDPDTVVIQVPQNPALTVSKTATLSIDNGTPNIADVGDEITFTVSVQNTGNVTLTNLVVND
ncbi:MAG: DUF11 domain-containing protein, partial [Xanthomonadales bacterium]|nr:DUF11 domain-containing protein [Xanthomonadales bacterium]